jgi:hypothetical protein
MSVLERILCAAIHHDDGVVREGQPINILSGIVFSGYRHWNCMVLFRCFFDVKVTRKMQGFLTSKNRYVDRQEAYWIAKNAGQLLHDLHDRSNLQLVSEDLY